MKILLIAALAAVAMAAAADYTVCWECIINGGDWVSDACAEWTDSSSSTISYDCTISYDYSWTTYNQISDYGEAEGQEPITFTLNADTYDYTYWYCYPSYSSTEVIDDEEPQCTITADDIGADIKVYVYSIVSTTSYTMQDLEITELATGDSYTWLQASGYAYMYGFNGGAAAGDVVISYQSAQSMLFGVVGLLASLLYLA